MEAPHDNGAEGRSTAPPRHAAFPSHGSFVAALCRGEAAALREFFLMYAPLLRDHAQRMHVPVDERAELVTTVLDDVAMHLNGVAIPPREFTRYLVAALRNRARTRHRDRTRRQASDERSYTTLDTSAQRVIAECHSEYGLDSARAPGHAPAPPLSVAIEQLAAMSARLPHHRIRLDGGPRPPRAVAGLAAQSGITMARRAFGSTGCASAFSRSRGSTSTRSRPMNSGSFGASSVAPALPSVPTHPSPHERTASHDIFRRACRR